MDQNTPGPPVFHCLPNLGQIHVGSFDDPVQPSHPLSSPSLLAFTLSQHEGLFQGVFSSHEMAKVLEPQWVQHYSELYSRENVVTKEALHTQWAKPNLVPIASVPDAY